MIHICFALNDKTGRYSKFTGTTILSIFENTTSAVTVHILHDNTLTNDNRDKFIQLAKYYGQAVKFYNVAEICADSLQEILSLNSDVENLPISSGTLYKLLIPQALPTDIDKVIYLDADIIVNLDINELWQIELNENLIGGVPEILSYKTASLMKKGFLLCQEGLVKCEDYFNAGVLVMNLKLLRNEEAMIKRGARFRAQNYRYRDYTDQNIWNYCFSKMALKLPAKFNKHIQFIRLEKEKLDRKIYHYSGGNFGIGLGLDMNDEFNRLWMNYFIKSPWFDAEAIGRLYESFLELKVQQEKNALKLSSIVSGKTRAFVILEKDINMFVENFSVKPGEEVLAIESSLPLQKLVDLMNASRGKKIFIILLPDFELEKLTKFGLVRGKDFLDGYDLSPKNKISRKEEYQLIKSL